MIFGEEKYVKEGETFPKVYLDDINDKNKNEDLESKTEVEKIKFDKNKKLQDLIDFVSQNFELNPTLNVLSSGNEIYMYVNTFF